MTINKFSLVSLLILFNTMFLSAQVDQKYLAGAVPLVDGKVVFKREVAVSPSIPVDLLLSKVEQWAKAEFEANKYEGSKQRVLLVKPDENYLVVQGDEKLVFKSQLLMLDQTTITYQLVIDVAPGKCNLTMRYIKYEYQDYKDLVPAEEMIVDKYALHKSGEKLNRHYDKFRTFTIDRIDAIADSLQKYIGGTSVKAEEPKTEQVTPKREVLPAPVQASSTPTVAIAGYKQMAATELSDNITQMFKDNWAVVVAGTSNDKKVMPALWSGLGSFGSKPVSMTIVKAGDNKEEVYTISFYSPIHKAALDKLEKGEAHGLTPITLPSGAQAFAEAWMIIECKKQLEQPATEAMINDTQSKGWSSKDFDKLFMGEIVDIWAR